MITHTYASHSAATFSVALLLLLLVSGCSSMADRVADAAQRGVERATEREVERRTDRATTQTIEGFENAVRCSVGDTACRDRARAEGRDVVYEDEDGNVVDTERNAPENVSTNYNFRPGTRVLFQDDFSNDRVGDFPSRLRYGRGNFEVVDWNGRRLLSNTGSEGWFDVPLPETLPDRFTVEFDIHDPRRALYGTGVFFGPVTAESSFALFHGRVDEAHVRLGKGNAQESGVFADGEALSTNAVDLTKSLVRIEIQVDGDAVKVYANRSSRIANVPRIELNHGNAIKFAVDDYLGETMYLGNIRVAASE